VESNTNPFRIDVHHHFLFPKYLESLAKFGIKDSGGAPFPEWTPQKAQDYMDRNGILVALVGILHPGVYFGNTSAASDLARPCNESMAQLVQDRPKRFGGMATLPLPNVEASLCALEYAFDTLKLDGIGLLSSYEGTYLGDPTFAEVFAELNRRKAVVHVHPTIALKNSSSPIVVPGWCLEFVFDTTVTNLAATGTLKRYPDIKFIFSHGGGTVPYIAGRISGGVGIVNKEYTREEVILMLQGLYYDTALTSPYQYGSLQEFVEPSHIIFGSDYNFAKEDQTLYTINAIDSYDGFDEHTREAIYYKNALALFPRLQNMPSKILVQNKG
jgi:predicted TIM-barrel fold metal-dependent hydrolase